MKIHIFVYLLLSFFTNSGNDVRMKVRGLQTFQNSVWSKFPTRARIQRTRRSSDPSTPPTPPGLRAL